MQRRLAAIMFTDMVGYTALGQRNESLALALVEEQRKLVRSILSKYDGREVKTIGDAFLVEFGSAMEAVECAVEIQSAVKEANLTNPEDKKIKLRIGIHLGDVMHDGNDVAGDAVNVASRIEPLSPVGGVCISGEVFHSVINKVGVQFESLGYPELKNVSNQVEVFRVTGLGELVGKPEQKGPLPKERLAVLPLLNLSPDPSDAYFTDGLTEELITTMSRIGGLKVIARTSVMGYKGGGKTVSQIASELKVGTILEGSVRKAGNKIRLTVQLVDTRSQEHLWDASYNRTLDDIFSIQTDLASKVADSLSMEFSRVRDDTESVEAYTLYMRGTQLLSEGTERSMRDAISMFEKAISADNSFVRAYTGIVDALGTLAAQNLEEYTGALKRSELLARKALEIGPNWPEAHGAMASVFLQLDREREAIAEATIAVQINPNLSRVYETLGSAYSTMGHLEQGIENMRKSLDLSPLSFQRGHSLCHAYLAAGRENQAMRLAEHYRVLHPRNPLTFHCLAQCYIQTRDLASAQQAIDLGRELDSNSPVLIVDQGLVFALAGNRKAAEDQLCLIQKSDKESVRLFGQVWICSALGDLDKAFEALMRQAEIHSWYSLMKTERLFEALRNDPRFAEFCKRVGLPP